MVEIAILGYGTVGTGVVEVLKTNQKSIDKKASQNISIKYVLDVRDLKNTPAENLATQNFNAILHDEDVKIVVEVMGGVEPAYTYVKNSLLKGKSVVTSNKELVAKHGTELIAIANANNVNFLFEASVGGGIPIIRPLNECLTADEIYEITGILNGTTNYILTKMEKEGLDFDSVLKEAQEKGYAEKNPEADVEGYDACRKIAILLSIATGKQVKFEDIYTEGITKITQNDILYANKLGCKIKLLATAKINEKGTSAIVCPTLIDNSHPISAVKDVFNAIYIKGNIISEIMFYGEGAGKLPTASAVVADVINAVRNPNKSIIPYWTDEKSEIVNTDNTQVKKFVRVNFSNKQSAVNSVFTMFNINQIIEIPSLNDEFGFITEISSEKEINNKIELLLKDENVTEIKSSIRLL